MVDYIPLKLKILESQFDVYSLPNFIKSHGKFDAETTTFIEEFDAFRVCITERLTVPNVSCIKDCAISWSDMTGKTDHHFRKKFMALNEDKSCQYTLNFILNDKSWEKLHSIIGRTLMTFILTKSILLRAAPADDVYFVVNRDCDHFCSELNLSYNQKSNIAKTVSSMPSPRLQAKNLNGQSFNSKEITVERGGLTSVALKNSGSDYLSFGPALYSRSNSLLWPKKNPMVSRTVDEILESILYENDRRTPYYLEVQADRPKLLDTQSSGSLDDLKTIISDIVSSHKTKLYDKIIRRFSVFKPKKSATKIRLEKRRRKVSNKNIRPFPSREAGEKFLKKKLKFVKPMMKAKVVLILTTLIRKLLYPILCGSKANFSVLKKQMSKFFNLGKGQSVSVDFFIHRIQLRSINWLKKLSSLSTKKLLFCKVFGWFFNHYLLTFLKTYFYVTDTGKSKNGVSFFDKISWISMKKVYLKYLSRSGKFQRINEIDAEKFSRIAATKCIGHFRFIPKTNGLRPLTLLRHNDEDKKILNYYKTIVQQLFHNLNESPGKNEILDSLNNYYKKMKSVKANLYFVKVDVFDAFGSILQDKLINIIEEGLTSVSSSKGLLLHKVDSISYNQSQKKFYPGKRIRYTINMSRVNAPRNSINIFSRKETRIDVDAVIFFLKNFIKSHVFRDGPLLFHQVTGVPQSNPLSSIFSDLYYNDLTRQHFQRFAQERNLLFRYTDDFIFITPNRKEAEDFYDTVSKGFPDYNCFFVKEKLETNLPRSPNSVSKLNFFGFSIDVCSSTVTVDYSSFNKTNLLSSISLLENQSVSKVLEYHFRNLQICVYSFYQVTLRYHFNSLDTMALNFYEAAVMVATKLRILVRALFHNCNNIRYLLRVVLDLISKFEDHNEQLRKYRRFMFSRNFVTAITIDGFQTCFRNNPYWYEVSFELDQMRQTVHSSLSSNERQRLHRILNDSASSSNLHCSLNSQAVEY